MRGNPFQTKTPTKPRMIFLDVKCPIAIVGKKQCVLLFQEETLKEGEGRSEVVIMLNRKKTK